MPMISYLPKRRRGHADCRRVPGGCLVTLAGDIDLASRQKLDAAVAAVLTSMPGDVLLDVTAVTFFGSEGLGFLARLLQAVVDGDQGRITLHNPSRRLLQLVEMFGMRDRLQVSHDADAS